jgi:hypothetical protein
MPFGMPSNHVQRTLKGAAAALLPGPDFLLVAGTHRNMSAVNETETVTEGANARNPAAGAKKRNVNTKAPIKDRNIRHDHRRARLTLGCRGLSLHRALLLELVH